MNSTMTTTPWEQVRQESLAAMTETERAEYDAAAIEAEARLQAGRVGLPCAHSRGNLPDRTGPARGDAPVCHLRH